MRADGFYVLSYFNVHGVRRRDEVSRRRRGRPPTEADLWKDPNDYLYAKFPEALLLRNGRPIRTPATGRFVMDPGEPAYQQFLLEQARRHIERLPDSAGICIDRLDWLRPLQPPRRRRTELGGRPARPLAVSSPGGS